MRVYEVARELGIENKELMRRISTLGIPVSNHMSVLEQFQIEQIRRAIDKENAGNVVEERIRPTVVRRTRKKEAGADEAPAATPPQVEERIARPAVPMASEPRPAAAVVKQAPRAEAAPAPRVEAEPTRAEAKAPESVPVASTPSRDPEENEAPVRRAEASPVAAPRAESQPEEAPRAPRPSDQRGPSQPVRRPVASESDDAPARVVPRSELRAESETVAVKVPAPTQEELEGMSDDRSSVAPSSTSERFAHTHLPPGVTRRGNTVATSSLTVSDEKRRKIVAQHQQQQTQTRRKIVNRSSIGPAGRPPARPARRPKPGAPGTVKRLRPLETSLPGAQKRIIRIEDQIQLQTLAQRMSLKATDVLMELIQQGVTNVHINSTLDADTATLLASVFNYEVENVARTEDEIVGDARGDFENLESDRALRAPVVTVMGHVDHGKTSLLDKIRNETVAAGEAGGITQHIGAYRVEIMLEGEARSIVFLDTPGHEAFTAMRARGADATDVVILVVAADDGIMPQTREAITHAKQAKVPIVVALNKCDREDAQPERVKHELASLGLQPEEWGGETIFVETSAHTGLGIERLLQSVLLQAELLDLQANVNIPAEGVVLEAKLDRGRGPVANVLVRDGTLKPGDYVVAGQAWGRVRAMMDDRGRIVKVAGPATPVEILGLQDLPSAGDMIYQVKNQKKAQEVAESYKKAGGKPIQAQMSGARGLEEFQKMMNSGDVEELRLVLKADVQGSLEALKKSLLALTTDKVKVNIILSGVGGITENDIMLAAGGNAMVIGFNVRPQGKGTAIAKKERVDVRNYSIIYEALDDVRAAMRKLLAPNYIEKELGKAQVRMVFTIPKAGTIAGSMVLDGKILRTGKARVVRAGEVLFRGDVASLRRHKDDVKEVGTGFECGIGLAGFNEMQEGDIIEAYELVQIEATL